MQASVFRCQLVYFEPVCQRFISSSESEAFAKLNEVEPNMQASDLCMPEAAASAPPRL
jgi:hypothetical protein